MKDRPTSAPTSRSARRDERGMSTVEYAVGTLGACSIGGVLTQVATSDWFGDIVRDVVSYIPNLLPF